MNFRTADGERAGQKLAWLSLAFTITVTGCLAWILFDSPRSEMAHNGDTLLASAWARIVLHDHYSIRSFQLPATTSVFPDLIIHGILQSVLGWRHASLIYGWLQLLALTSICALIARRIAKVPLSLGGAIFALLAAILLSVDNIPTQSNVARSRLVLEIVAHGGTFLLTLLGALLVCRIAMGGGSKRTTWLLCALSFVAYFSDQLTALEFFAPIAVVLALLRAEIDWRGSVTRIFTPMVLGVALSHLVFLAVRREHAVYTRGNPLHFLADSTPIVIALWYVPAILMFALPFLPAALRARIAPFLPSFPARFHWLFATSATFLTMAATLMLVYTDDGGFRYFYTLAWWPIILATALLGYHLARFHHAAISIAAIALLFVLVRVPQHAPAILSWTDPVTNCLQANRERYGLDAGLAGYWSARSVEASSDWAIPMEQIVPTGHRYYWGNDRERYWTLSSRYNFIVMQNLDPVSIRKRYGRPVKTFSCADTQVWVFRDGQIGPALIE